MAQKMTGALVFDERTDRYDIRFDLAMDSLRSRDISTTTGTPFHSGTTGTKMTYRRNTRL